MTVDLDALLPIILYVVLILFVLALIVLTFKIIKTLEKVDRLLDDANSKMKRVDGVFDVIDKVTDYTASISDRIIGAISDAVSFLFKKLKKGRDENE